MFSTWTKYSIGTAIAGDHPAEFIQITRLVALWAPQRLFRIAHRTGFRVQGSPQKSRQTLPVPKGVSVFCAPGKSLSLIGD
jgi:hypothetical protein